MTEISTLNGKTNKTNLISNLTISYLDLRGSYCEHLVKAGKSKQEIKNARGSVKSWCLSLRFKIDNLIGNEFDRLFDKEIQNYIKEQINLGIQKKTYSSRVSLIRSIRVFYLNQIKTSSLPTDFSERVKYLFVLNNYTCKNFWTLYLTKVISYETLLSWISGRCSPMPQKLFVVEMAEKYLQVAAGTLTSTLRPHKTAFNSLITPNKRSYEKYLVFTPSIAIEYQGLVEFKSSVVPPVGMNRRKRSVWTGEKGKTPPSALLCEIFLRRFFGFCCLPVEGADPLRRGLGLNENDLSLALLADAKIVEEFITVFLLARSNGKYNAGTLVFISLIASFLRKDTGYLYQKPEFARKIRMPDDVAAWQEKCIKTRQRLNEIKEFIEQEKASGGENFGFGRDPEEPIKEILQSPRPIFFTMQMVKNMLADVEKMSNMLTKQAILYRDLLLIAMLQANPLRIKMFSEMKFDKHLIKKADGSWWLTFKRHEFKNRQFLKSDYEARVAPDIWNLIDEYKNKFRERFKGAKESSSVFLTSYVNPAEPQNQYKISAELLSERVANMTRHYIPNSSGFRAQAFRHIVATDIIKSNPRFGFFLAAKVLHDKLETVETNYAHLKTSEFFEPYNELFSGMWKSVKPTDSEPKDPLLNERNPNADGGEACEA